MSDPFLLMRHASVLVCNRALRSLVGALFLTRTLAYTRIHQFGPAGAAMHMSPPHMQVRVFVGCLVCLSHHQYSLNC